MILFPFLLLFLSPGLEFSAQRLAFRVSSSSFPCHRAALAARVGAFANIAMLQARIHPGASALTHRVAVRRLGVAVFLLDLGLLLLFHFLTFLYKALVRQVPLTLLKKCTLV